MKRPAHDIYRIATLIFCLALCGTQLAVAQQEDRSNTLSSPHAAMRMHLYFLQPETYRPELSAMTMAPGMDPAQARNLAIKLKQIYDGKGLYVRLNMIPQYPLYIDSAAMAHLYTPFPEALPEVYLERIDTNWHYSAETMKAIPELHRKLYPLGADLLSKRIPSVLQYRILGIGLWQYIGIIGLLLGCMLVHFVLNRLLRPLMRWLASLITNWGYAEPADVINASRYVSLLIGVMIAGRLLPLLQLPIRTSVFIKTALELLTILLSVFLALVVLRVVTHRVKMYTQATESRLDDQLLPVLRKLLQIIIIVIGILYILNIFNVNVTALIAGVSIGALAVALAAQDTVKNLIGSLMIFLDKPFQVGDFVIADGLEGTIREVGFRSTRIQTIDTSMVVVPNGHIANISITNLGVRTYRLMNVMLGITYDTPPDKIRDFVTELKTLIIAHPRIEKERYFVAFREMGDSALRIQFRCLIKAFDLGEELIVREEINLQILEIAARMGVSFAFPTTTVHLESERMRK